MSSRDPRASLRDSANAGSLMAPVYGLVERAINDALRYDPATRQRLAAHKGRVLAIECRQPPLNAYFLLTAEGVENMAQLDQVITEGCTEMQGFLMSEALPADEVERLFFSGCRTAKAVDSAEAA